MAIVTAVGKSDDLKALATSLEERGFTVSTLVESSSNGAPANVGVFGVTMTSGGEVASTELGPLLGELREKAKTESPPGFAMLLATDRQPRAITWDHDGDECVAVVGQPIKWRAYPKRNSTRYGPWRTGRTVWQIADGPTTWRVQLSIVEPRDVWTDFIMCGDSAEVEWF
jgi:hypothetical protein